MAIRPASTATARKKAVFGKVAPAPGATLPPLLPRIEADNKGPRYRRNPFYLKIEGLTGPRPSPYGSSE